MVRSGYFVKGINATSVYDGRYVFGGEEEVYAMTPTDVGVGNCV